MSCRVWLPYQFPDPVPEGLIRWLRLEALNKVLRRHGDGRRQGDCPRRMLGCLAIPGSYPGSCPGS